MMIYWQKTQNRRLAGPYYASASALLQSLFIPSLWHPTKDISEALKTFQQDLVTEDEEKQDQSEESAPPLYRRPEKCIAKLLPNQGLVRHPNREARRIITTTR